MEEPKTTVAITTKTHREARQLISHLEPMPTVGDYADQAIRERNERERKQLNRRAAKQPVHAQG